MRITYGLKGKPERRTIDRDIDIVRIGSDNENDLILNNLYVSPRHAILNRNNNY
jgi:pSer/pThr/pTyr-binding forkhead associated (FHA) protein